MGRPQMLTNVVTSNTNGLIPTAGSTKPGVRLNGDAEPIGFDLS
jgi:hypothetical protein